VIWRIVTSSQKQLILLLMIVVRVAPQVSLMVIVRVRVP
jgi:hypothetical protein